MSLLNAVSYEVIYALLLNIIYLITSKNL